MNIVLFALTGIGNTVLRALAEIGQAPVLVVTRKETGVYPHYGQDQLSVDASRLDIPILIGEEGEREAARLRPDVIFSATYHRLISNDVASSAKHAFNLHPSLLPSYPGKNPFYWVLINGEHVTGVSIHRLIEKFDMGEIVFQKKMKIRPDETQGSLRRSLANLAGEATKEFFGRLEAGDIAASLPGPTSEKGRFGQVTESDRIVDLKGNAETICRQIRALTPWPRATLQETGSTVREVILIDQATSSNTPPGTVLYADKAAVRVRVADAELVFSIDSGTTASESYS